MTNAELIERLKTFPENAEVSVLPDLKGEPIYPNAVFYSKKDDEITLFWSPFKQNF